jgi:hypothetical protein
MLTTSTENSDVDPLADEKPSPEPKPAPTASDETVAAGPSAERRRRASSSSQLNWPSRLPCPPAEKSDVDLLAGKIPSSSEAEPAPTASEDVVAGGSSWTLSLIQTPQGGH